jgi:hypothetical protein
MWRTHHVPSAAEAASHFIAESGITETFYIYDLGEVARLYNTWRAAMPRVMPHYAGALMGYAFRRPKVTVINKDV